jgi:hypothetical protein
VFGSQPQDVEVYHGGAWLAGSMLGWRHDADGGCQAWVRLDEGGDEPIWTGLEALRLPERHLAVAPEPASEAVVDLAVARRARPLRDPSSTGPVIRVMPALREGVPTGRAAHPAGRRRAPDTGEFPVVPVASFPAGRHRAPSPAGAGRHRAADTGVMPAVTAIDATREMPRARASVGGDARPGRRATPTTPELDLLTRPMHLGDFLAEPRDRRSGGRLDDTLTGV